MQLVGIGFNPSFWRFLLQRLEKHTGHGPLVGTLLDPSYLQPDRLVSTCTHLQDLLPVFTFFTPHGFREHRDCIFFLSQMQARLREVPLALVLENIQEELSPFLPPSPWVRLTNQMHFQVSEFVGFYLFWARLPGSSFSDFQVSRFGQWISAWTEFLLF